MKKVIFTILICLIGNNIQAHSRSRTKRNVVQRDNLYAQVAPWFNADLRKEYSNLLIEASLNEQIEWLRERLAEKQEYLNKRDALYTRYVNTMTESQRYNYSQRPTLREQVDWLQKYDRTIKGLSGGLQEVDIDESLTI
jgi:hypothetical protein